MIFIYCKYNTKYLTRRYMDIPQYDGKSSITLYLQKVEAYKITLQKDRYTLILKFINEWLKLTDKYKYKSLLEFKNIDEMILIADEKHNAHIIKKYIKDLEKAFNVNFTVTDETDTDEIKEKYIIFVVTKALSTIDYTLSYKTSKGETCYTIKMK